MLKEFFVAIFIKDLSFALIFFCTYGTHFLLVVFATSLSLTSLATEHNIILTSKRKIWGKLLVFIRICKIALQDIAVNFHFKRVLTISISVFLKVIFKISTSL